MSLTRGHQRCSVVSTLNEYGCCNFMNGVVTGEQKLTETQYCVICMLHSRSSIAVYHIDHVRWLISNWRSIFMGLR